LNGYRFLRKVLFLCLLSGTVYAQDLPFLGLAHVGVAVSDIDKARGFYNDVLGLDMGFDLKKPDNSLFLQYYKVNDNQFIEVYPTLRPGAVVRETHIAFFTNDIQELHKGLEARGLTPSPVGTNHWDHNQSFDMRHPAGQELVFLEFVQYMPGSLHMNNRGKALSNRRISSHMIGAGVLVNDPAAAEGLYKAMGFREVWRGSVENGQRQLIDMQMPGNSGDYVQLVEPAVPVTAEQAGRAGHIALEVSKIQAAYKTAKKRGANIAGPPVLSSSKMWDLGLLDPDGTEVIFQQPTKARVVPAGAAK
jgi:catechol 2,3-dioxygenase-like lactoylglutathione lyase family enzyme